MAFTRFMAVLVTVGVALTTQAFAGDIACKGTLPGDKRVTALLQSEFTAKSELRNVAASYRKYNVAAYEGEGERIKPKNLKASAEEYRDTFLYELRKTSTDEIHKMYVRLPKSGTGKGVMSVKLPERKLAALPLTCEASEGFSGREKNAACTSVVLAAAEKEARKEDPNAAVYEEELQVLDSEMNTVDWSIYTGTYTVSYSLLEQCFAAFKIKTVIDENNKCKVISIENFGDRECG